jgi:uncharacterized membrane protein
VTTLSVWTYPDGEGARRLEQRLAEGAAGDVAVRDGALATWVPGRAAPRVRDLQRTARTDSFGVGFWGLLFGIVVAGPELSDLGGGTQQALDGSLSGIGVDRRLLADLRRGLRPGCSALAVIADEAVVDDIHAASTVGGAGTKDGTRPDQVLRRLTPDQEAALQRVFSA